MSCDIKLVIYVVPYIPRVKMKWVAFDIWPMENTIHENTEVGKAPDAPERESEM